MYLIYTLFSSLLTVGEYFAINYTAILDAKETWNGRVLTLPAKLTFRSSSQVFPVQVLKAVLVQRTGAPFL